ncbi:hypothetical protein HETIRDRAFT_331157 [Heterobasidion irregulare TC 32-1]|uniref:Uncharacterized protein n=1 Tax=Heterobasidion irregulare (strain TC 32-1) TaxID=747525 RepID=W4JPS1_HETIT|nr:uncharacterized protein HETIRDRAFT_331157 [Heterobasidion irregulare TC 32-1]ETW75572.1 hypothetical protein HETIRDRAFT_331157 [Heterobasidion irregulare TC 32-1]
MPPSPSSRTIHKTMNHTGLQGWGDGTDPCPRVCSSLQHMVLYFSTVCRLPGVVLDRQGQAPNVPESLRTMVQPNTAAFAERKRLCRGTKSADIPGIRKLSNKRTKPRREHQEVSIGLVLLLKMCAEGIERRAPQVSSVFDMVYKGHKILGNDCYVSNLSHMLIWCQRGEVGKLHYVDLSRSREA